MAKVTSRLQVTIPKAIADSYGIQPGDDVEFVPAREGIRIVRRAARTSGMSVAERLALFDAATDRQRRRNRAWKGQRKPRDRRWTRAALYDRGRAS